MIRSRSLVAVPLVLVALLVGGCGKSGGDEATDNIAKNMAKHTGMSAKDAKTLLQSGDGGVQPKDLPKGWGNADLTGYWLGPTHDGFTPNVNVYSFLSKDSPGTSLADLRSQAKASSSSLAKDFAVVGEGPIDFQGRRSQYLEYTASFAAREGHGYQVFTKVDGRMYAITGTTAADGWAADRDDVMQVIDSLDLEHRKG